MEEFITPGQIFRASKTLTETDIAFFCAISGDFDPIHVDEQYAAGTRFKHRIAHGILSMALLSTVAARVSAAAKERGFPGTSVSLGYDRIRFLRPVFAGETLTGEYTLGDFDAARGRTTSRVIVANERGETCVAGDHVMRWLTD